MIQKMLKLLLKHGMYDKYNLIFIFIIYIYIYMFYQNESCLRTEDILDILRHEGHSIALVMFGGVHYYTGQLFDIETITDVAHEQV